MKPLAILILLIFCLSTAGCGSLVHIMQDNSAGQLHSAWSQGAHIDRQASSFRIFNAEPYTVHLEVEDTEPKEGLEQLNGDGGASLNAYAACLTLKVIF